MLMLELLGLGYRLKLPQLEESLWVPNWLPIFQNPSSPQLWETPSNATKNDRQKKINFFIRFNFLKTNVYDFSVKFSVNFFLLATFLISTKIDVIITPSGAN